MNTEEVAKKVMELVRKHAWYEALDTLYDDNIVSVEAFSMSGGSPETRGKEAVRGKIDWWVNATEVHNFTANGPFVGHDRFVLQYDADVTDKNSKQRRKLSEVGIYTVKDGKIIREEFLRRRCRNLAKQSPTTSLRRIEANVIHRLTNAVNVRSSAWFRSDTAQ